MPNNVVITLRVMTTLNILTTVPAGYPRLSRLAAFIDSERGLEIMSSRSFLCVLLLGVLVVVSSRHLPSKEPAQALPTKVEAFSLKDPRDQQSVSLADWKEKKAGVVVFLGTECPISNLFVPVLADLHKEYSKRGVGFLAVNSNRQDTPDRVAAHARKHNIPFPVVKDANNIVADQFGAIRTPEAFVIDPTGRILYRGRGR